MDDKVTSKITYVVVQWPEVQVYMNEDWFDEECSLSLLDRSHGNGAYFVPVHRLL